MRTRNDIPLIKLVNCAAPLRVEELEYVCVNGLPYSQFKLVKEIRCEEGVVVEAMW